MVEVSKPVNLGQLSAELGGVPLWSSGPDASGVRSTARRLPPRSPRMPQSRRRTHPTCRPSSSCSPICWRRCDPSSSACEKGEAREGRWGNPGGA